MSLEYYPLDRQTCLIDLASYAYTTEDIIYAWKSEMPVQLKDGLRRSLPSFELQDVTTGFCTSKTNTGEYSCLRTTLILRREYSYYLITLYIPSFMLVMVSWVNFWIDKDAVPARVSLGVTTLLTMTTQASGVNAKLPPVSYTKAIDVWIGACLGFIFGALLEFALVNYAGRVEFLEKERKKNKSSLMHEARWPTNLNITPIPPLQRSSVGIATSLHSTSNPLRTTPFIENYPIEAVCPECKAEQREKERALEAMRPLIHNAFDIPPSVAFSRIPNRTPGKLRSRWCLQMWLVKYKERSKRIDVISRFIFPIGFFFFNCIYWVVYLV
ncbi:unnamed protein product [Soboliphyme baturini]|uniref:Ig-like domain-containing protein n=1 Tax=Soboliphyme baturini TaxID=241478 RepID=A0A183J0V2_9BILA|nr:unnamed protein product [Soboliphyme baturini]